MAYEVTTVNRHLVGDFLAAVSDTPTWYLMGKGTVQVDESPNPVVDKTIFVNDVSPAPEVTGYGRVFPFDVQLRTTSNAAMLLNDIYRNDKTGEDAQLLYCRADLFVTPTDDLYPARKFLVNVKVNDITGAGLEIVRIKGELIQEGAAVEGTMDIESPITFALPA